MTCNFGLHHHLDQARDQYESEERETGFCTQLCRYNQLSRANDRSSQNHAWPETMQRCKEALWRFPRAAGIARIGIQWGRAMRCPAVGVAIVDHEGTSRILLKMKCCTFVVLVDNFTKCVNVEVRLLAVVDDRFF